MTHADDVERVRDVMKATWSMIKDAILVVHVTCYGVIYIVELVPFSRAYWERQMELYGCCRAGALVNI